jgi:hypothetical protein
MSATLYVSCKKSSLPSRDQWQAAIKAAGFDLELKPFEWRTQSGPLPVVYKKSSTSFEMMVEDAKPVAKQLGIKLPDANDVVVSFVFGSDPEECDAATCASAALAKCVGGSYFDEYSDDLLDGATAVSIAHDSLQAD